jgi:hypothetical protein
MILKALKRFAFVEMDSNKTDSFLAGKMMLLKKNKKKRLTFKWTFSLFYEKDDFQ